jgi:hypothetical protein
MPPNPEPRFPPGYRAARKAFIAACTKARADAISRAHMGRQGPDGKPVFIDSVALGPRDAEKGVLVIANDASASNAAAAFLNEAPAMPKGVRLVVVHALDPFAFMGSPGDPVWSRAMLEAITTEDLSRVTELAVLGFGITEDELTAIFPTDRKVRLIREPVKARTDAAKMRNAIEAEVARIQRGN